MTDSLRDEVRAICGKVEDYAEAEALFHQKTGLVYWHDPELEMTADEATDAITNLVLGVKELEWREIGEEVWFSQNGLGGTCQIEFDEGSQKYRSLLNTAGETLSVGVADTLEAAKAACQADFVKRIQSALTAKPAPVVSDCAIRSKVIEELANDAEEEREHWEVGPPCSPEEAARYRQWALELDKRAARRLVEEEVRADERAEHLAEITELRDRLHTKHSEIRAEERERLCEALTPSCETKAAFMGKFSFLIDELDEGRDVRPRKITVPWDTIKEIMAAIRAPSQGEGK